MRFFPFSILVFLFVQVFALNISANSQQAVYWEGKLNHGKQTWDIGISIESDSKAKFYSKALLRAGVEAEEYSKKGTTITFKLPFELGRFSGQIQDGKLFGKVMLANGAVEHIELSPKILQKPRKEEFVVQNGEIKIAATLALPEKKGVYPLVVILHGGGDSSRESPPYAFFADFLPNHGIACLIYDKRGNGKSTGSWRTVGFDERAEDIVLAVALLKKHGEIDPKKMGLVGVSQGSWVAGIAADKSPDISFVVNVVGPVVTPFEADTYAQKYRFS